MISNEVTKRRVINKQLPNLLLAVICLGTLLLTLPTIGDNIDDPNMIVYLNHDEGGFMDIAWSYYSGERRISSQWPSEYGLELRYLTDFSKVALSPFIEFEPGTFVLILRWLYLFAWILSFFALWHLVGYHFGSNWQGLLAVALLATRPVFPFIYEHLKPEPLVLLVMLVGLDYTLRIIKEPLRRRNLLIATGCASIAFLIKYAGIFLLPAIVASMFFARRYQSNLGNEKSAFPEIRISWILPALPGLIMIFMPILLISFYVRQSSGSTWYEEFGLWKSILQNKAIFYMITAGILLTLLSCVMFVLKKIKRPSVEKIMKRVNELNSYSLIACSLFAFGVIIFGFRWILFPRHLFDTYAQMGQNVFRGEMLIIFGEPTLSCLKRIYAKISEFDPIIISIFLFYIGMEIYGMRKKIKDSPLMICKRLVLLVFAASAFIIMFSHIRMTPTHTLPFFVAIAILSIQGLHMFHDAFKSRRVLSRVITLFIILLFLYDISVNAATIVRERMYQFRGHEDIAYEIGDWWRKNISPDTKVVSAHLRQGYIPPEYKNIETPDWGEKFNAQKIRELIDKYKPGIVYYNQNDKIFNAGTIPPLEEILPDRKVNLLKSFENMPGNYAKHPGCRFLVYEVLYEKDS